MTKLKAIPHFSRKGNRICGAANMAGDSLNITDVAQSCSLLRLTRLANYHLFRFHTHLCKEQRQ